jgi:3-hydroxyisobutyrate dehydrogenase-like beta-hydroxyacid dehydrogenase
MEALRIGQVGLGAIGQIYAGHLVRAFGRLHVYDIAAERLAEAVSRGAIAAGSASEVAGQSEIIFLALPSPEAVRSVVLDPNGILAGAQAGSLFLDASTVDPDTCRQLYRAAKDQGVDYVDAPVSGGAAMAAGTEGAKAHSLTFMAGGDRSAFERAIPVMRVLGQRWFYLGPAGSGATVKLISNLMSGLHNLVAAEALVLGAAAGFSWETLLEVFNYTDARSYQLTDQLAPRMRRHDFEAGFSVDLMHKDHRLAGELGHQLDVPLPFNTLGLEIYHRLREHGWGQKDFCIAIDFVAAQAKVALDRPRPHPSAPAAGH